METCTVEVGPGSLKEEKITEERGRELSRTDKIEQKRHLKLLALETNVQKLEESIEFVEPISHLKQQAFEVLILLQPYSFSLKYRGNKFGKFDFV